MRVSIMQAAHFPSGRFAGNTRFGRTPLAPAEACFPETVLVAIRPLL